MPGPALGDIGVSGVAGKIRMMKLDVEGPDVRGCRDPDVTSAPSQGMGERSVLTEQLAWTLHFQAASQILPLQSWGNNRICLIDSL